MRNSIYSSIANVIRRFSAIVVDMSRFDGLPAYQWHQPCAVQPAGDVCQRRHLGLLTAAGTGGIALGNLLEMSRGKRESVNERNYATTGTCQLSPLAGGSGHTS